MMGVRKLLDLVFSKNELKILDDILPEFKRHERLDKEEEHDKAVAAAEGGNEEEPGYEEELAKRRQSLRYTESSIEVPMANGNVMKIPISGEGGNGNGSDINISEEMNKSGVWKSLEGSSNSLESKAE